MNKSKIILYTIIICILTFLFFCITSIHILNNETFLESLYYINDSPIHGKGVFASVKLNKDSDLGIIVINGKKNMKIYRRHQHDRFFNKSNGELFKEHRALGRFINHSENPNTIIILNRNSCSLKTIRDIKEGEEITTDYTPFRNAYLNGYMGDVNV